jgi:hypothetical protein
VSTPTDCSVGVSPPRRRLQRVQCFRRHHRFVNEIA